MVSDIKASEIDALIDAEMGAGHYKKRDNRVPHSRTVKIIENAKKAWAAAAAVDHEKTLAAARAETKADTERPLLARIAKLEARIREVDVLGDRLLEAPEQFLRALVQLNPAVAQFVSLDAAPRRQTGSLFDHIVRNMASQREPTNPN